MQNYFSWQYIKTEPRIWAPLFSLIIAVYMSYSFYINNDGIFYLKGAEDFLANGLNAWHPALRWPFYSVLIALFSKFTHLSLLHSALVLQALFLALLMVNFINIVRLLGGNKTIQIIAAMTILLHPQLNTERNEILRDFGYWAFLITSFYYLLRYFQLSQLRDAILFFGSIIIATLFRIEGVVIILLAPLLALFLCHETWSSRLKRIFYLYLPGLIIVLLLTIILSLYSQNVETLGRLAELPKWFNYVSGGFIEKMTALKVKVRSVFPIIHIDGIISLIVGSLIFYLFYMLISATNPFYFILAVYGQCKNHLSAYINQNNRYVLYGFLGINFIIPIFFLSYQFFLRERFLLATSLILAIWVPFTTYTIYKQWQTSAYYPRYKQLGYACIGMIAIFLFIDSTLDINSPAKLIKESAAWVQNHTSENASVYSNSPALVFYAQRQGVDLTQHPIGPPYIEVIANNNWAKYDYLAFYITHKDKVTEKFIVDKIPYSPIKTLQDRRGNKVIIYKVIKVNRYRK